MTDLDTTDTDTVGPPPSAAGDGRRARHPRRRIGAALFIVALVAVLVGSALLWRSDGRGSGDETLASGAGGDVAAATTSPEPTSPPTTKAPKPPALRSPTADAPATLWFSGDSTAYTIGQALLRQNGEGLLDTELRLKTSSGMSRPDFFDWNAFIKAVVDLGPPEVMLLSMGANDAQPIQSPDGTWHTDVHSQGWYDEYHRRVAQLSQTVVDAGTRLYWIGQPIAREPGYNAFVNLVNRVYQQIDDEVVGVVYVNTYDLLADENGGYRDAIPGPPGQPPVVIRQPDGIHLEDAGGDLAAAEILAQLRRDWGG